MSSLGWMMESRSCGCIVASDACKELNLWFCNSDLNTRFSGITDENFKDAVLPLASIRKSLDAFINSNTILVGHALENDLKTLRMVHHRCVDTATMPSFRHRAGPPYRNALRNLYVPHYYLRSAAQVALQSETAPEEDNPSRRRACWWSGVSAGLGV